MYEIKNRASRVTTIALPGRDIILQPRGKVGSTAKVNDREYGEDGVKSRRQASIIRCQHLAVDETSHEEKTPVTKVTESKNDEERRIAATEAAKKRAIYRNARASNIAARGKAGMKET